MLQAAALVALFVPQTSTEGFGILFFLYLFLPLYGTTAVAKTVGILSSVVVLWREWALLLASVVSILVWQREALWPAFRKDIWTQGLCRTLFETVGRPAWRRRGDCADRIGPRCGEGRRCPRSGTVCESARTVSRRSASETCSTLGLRVDQHRRDVPRCLTPGEPLRLSWSARPPAEWQLLEKQVHSGRWTTALALVTAIHLLSRTPSCRSPR
jgi:hypothetical protein